MLNEGDLHPRLQEAADAFEATLGALIDAAALGGDQQVVAPLVDLGTWEALRRRGSPRTRPSRP